MTDIVTRGMSANEVSYIPTASPISVNRHKFFVQLGKRVLAGKQFVSTGLEFSEGTDAQVHRRHEILFCSDDEVLLERLTRFIAAALKAGNAAIALVTESHRGSLLQMLHAQGVDVDGFTRCGRARLPPKLRLLGSCV
jgi:hypothetical protein